MSKPEKKPLFHIVKRAPMPWWKAWLYRGLSIVLAMILCAVISLIMTGQNPVQIFTSIFNGTFGSPRKMWATGQNVAMLLVISLAVTPAFQMRFWNIGGEGQALMGCLASAACMITLKSVLPNWAVICVMLAASIIAGAVWGLIPAFFKAKWNTNETLFTLMMNYIATQLVAFFCVFWESPKGSGNIGVINQSSNIGWLPVVGGQKYLLSILIAAVLCTGMYFYLRFSKHGYELTVVGESEKTARYVGIKVDRVIMRTMILSGAMCGIAGFMLTGGTDHTLTTTLVDGRGFTAVMVSWLAKFNPVWMILASFLLVFLDRGASEMAQKCKLNSSFADILTGIILFFIIGGEFFINYRLCMRHSETKEGIAHV